MTPPAAMLGQRPEGWSLTEGSNVPISLGMDPARLAARHWPASSPRAIDLERAIDTVEEAIENSSLRHAPRGLLALDESVLAQLPPWHGGGLVMTRDEIEQAFSRLVASLPEPALAGESAAALLMLRELMHHLGYSQLRLRS